ncbi:hypothetical protein HW45_01880 [Vibrio sp. ER1A]|nr:hypothetical protein HW45_01880 [Vibrio sp. ER1A]
MVVFGDNTSPKTYPLPKANFRVDVEPYVTLKKPLIALLGKSFYLNIHITYFQNEFGCISTPSFIYLFIYLSIYLFI